MIGILIGIFVALSLTFYWSYNARIRRHIVSLYDEMGNATLAGNIHIAYTSSIAITSGLILIQNFSFFPALLFFSGIFIYLCAIFIDKYRGIFKNIFKNKIFFTNI